MTGETTITVIGNLTDAPELRYTQGGLAVAGFSIASTPRIFDRQTNDWKDGDTLFLRCSVWREYAEQVAASLSKGTRVIAQGNLVQKSYDDKKTGEKRTSYELQVLEIGPSLRYATASVTRAVAGQGGQAQAVQGVQEEWVPAGAAQPAQVAQPAAQQQPAAAVTWNTVTPGAAAGTDDDTPF